MNLVKDAAALPILPIANPPKFERKRALVLGTGCLVFEGDANALIHRVGHKGSIFQNGFLKHEAKEEHP